MYIPELSLVARRREPSYPKKVELPVSASDLNCCGMWRVLVTNTSMIVKWRSQSLKHARAHVWLVINPRRACAQRGLV